MTSFLRTVGLVILLTANGRAADHDWPAPPRAEDEEQPVSLSMSNRAGLVEAPFVTTAFPEVSGFGMILTGAAAVQFSSMGWLRLTLPVSVVRLDFPAGAQVSETALGNLELALEHGLEINPSTRFGFLAAFVAPSAARGPTTALLRNRALALASALNGGRNSALLTPGVSGLRLFASIEHSQRPFEFRASLDVPLVLRVSDANLPEETETHPIGILPAVDLRAAVWITSWFGASLGGGMLTELLRVQEPTLELHRKRRLQAVVEPGFHVRPAHRVQLGLDASIPVGGNLGGDAWSVGVQGRVGLW